MLFCQSKLVIATEELIASRGKEIEALLDLIRNKGNDVSYRYVVSSFLLY